MQQPGSGARRLRRCPQCGGLLPWLGWRLFFLSTALDPGNGGPLLQPRGQRSVLYTVPPALAPEPPPPLAPAQGGSVHGGEEAAGGGLQGSGAGYTVCRGCLPPWPQPKGGRRRRQGRVLARRQGRRVGRPAAAARSSSSWPHEPCWLPALVMQAIYQGSTRQHKAAGSSSRCPPCCPPWPCNVRSRGVIYQQQAAGMPAAPR